MLVRLGFSGGWVFSLAASSHSCGLYSALPLLPGLTVHRFCGVPLRPLVSRLLGQWLHYPIDTCCLELR